VYVRPILEYNCVVWSPSLKKDIDLIEKVQRRFTKRLCELKDLPYTAFAACKSSQLGAAPAASLKLFYLISIL